MGRFLIIALILIPVFLPRVIFSVDDESVLNQQITEYTNKLIELGNAKNTLANQISIIDSQVQLTLLKINQTQSSIKTLTADIGNLTTQIGKLDVSLNELSAVYIQQVNQNYRLSKKTSPLSIFLSSGSFNSFLEQYKYISLIQKNSQDTLVSLETVRTTADQQKTEKVQKQTELETLKKKLSDQQASLAKQNSAKKNLLEITKNDEKRYQQLLTEAQNQLRQLKSFSSTAGGSSCLSSSPGNGNDGMFYSQRDPVWCKQFIGNSQDTIGEVGCYISSISMVFKKLGTNITPSTYAADPSNFTLNTAYAKTPNPPSGYNFQQVNYSSATVDNELKNGRYVIAQIKMSGSISGMHFIVLISGSNGNYKMHDPWFGSDLDFSQHYNTSLIMSLRLFTK